MGIPVESSGSTQDGEDARVGLHKRGTTIGQINFQERLLQFDTALRPLLNDDFGVNMNQDVSFGGTPDIVTNGGDTAEWTFSNVSGSKASEQENERAKGAVVTIVDYTGLGGDTVTLGVDEVDTTKTEGSTWTAATSNDATATSLASDLDSITGVKANCTDYQLQSIRVQVLPIRSELTS